MPDAVPPFATDEALEVLRKQLGVRDLSTIFSTLSPAPVASASIGQVYRGTLAGTGVGGAYVASVLVVSHCWEQPGAPDEQGVQFAAVKAHLDAHPQIEWVWFDYWSMPQGKDKKDWEEAEFAVMLPNINLLYLFCSVLILLDLTYMGRFWTQFEAFLSMRTITAAARPAVAPAGERRASVACIHNAPSSFADALLSPHMPKSASAKDEGAL